ncbi:Signal peptidase subunit [Melia azedarach]|uniref:Signal peptidase subunit n=1 Tax=Melia azedarach TaxID=155640 RepID=A0ACC1XHF1_MELAZ|nr:Signal peptidase subunit [Melia azedarach]
MDWQGQKLAEHLMQIMLLAFAAVAFVAGYIMGSFQTMILIYAGGVVLTTLITVPDWPFFNRHPLNWLDPSEAEKHPKPQLAVSSKKKSTKKSSSFRFQHISSVKVNQQVRTFVIKLHSNGAYHSYNPRSVCYFWQQQRSSLDDFTRDSSFRILKLQIENRNEAPFINFVLILNTQARTKAKSNSPGIINSNFGSILLNDLKTSALFPIIGSRYSVRGTILIPSPVVD